MNTISNRLKNVILCTLHDNVYRAGGTYTQHTVNKETIMQVLRDLNISFGFNHVVSHAVCDIKLYNFTTTYSDLSNPNIYFKYTAEHQRSALYLLIMQFDELEISEESVKQIELFEVSRNIKYC